MDDLDTKLTKIERKIQKYNDKKYLLLKKQPGFNAQNTNDT